MKSSFFIILILFSGFFAHGQIGGDFSFSFLDLSMSSRTTALGGMNIATRDSDAGQALMNPALLQNSMHQSIGFHQNFYVAGISHSVVSYAHALDSSSFTLQGALQFINYGEFDGYDQIGNSTSSFNAGEQALIIGASKELYERVSIGANLKLINSSLEEYTSNAVALDLGIFFHQDEKNLGVSFLIRNMGTQLSQFTDASESLPLDVQIMINKQLESLPLRIGIGLHRLNRWDLTYDDPNLEENDLLFGQNPNEVIEEGFVTKLSRHLVINGEFLLGKNQNFHVRLGYRNQRRAELNLSTFRNLSGFSTGFGFRLSRFNIDYGIGVYHVGGNAHHISISSQLSRFSKDRQL